MIRRFRRHDAPEPETFGELVIHVEQWRIDPQAVVWQTGQAFDVKGMFAGLGIARDIRDIIGPENEHVPAMGPDKNVSKFVDKNLVAGVDCATRDGFTLLVAAAGRHFEILFQRVRRDINDITRLLADDFRAGDKETEVLRVDLDNHMVLLGINVVEVPAQEELLRDLDADVWLRTVVW